MKNDSIVSFSRSSGYTFVFIAPQSEFRSNAMSYIIMHKERYFYGFGMYLHCTTLNEVGSICGPRQTKAKDPAPLFSQSTCLMVIPVNYSDYGSLRNPEAPTSSFLLRNKGGQEEFSIFAGLPPTFGCCEIEPGRDVFNRPREL